MVIFASAQNYLSSGFDKSSDRFLWLCETFHSHKVKGKFITNKDSQIDWMKGKKNEVGGNWKLACQARASSKQAKGRDESETARLGESRLNLLLWFNMFPVSVILIALCVPLYEKRGRSRSNVTRGMAACYRGNSNIPFNT